jgi:Peptidase M61 N-terminal domain
MRTIHYTRCRIALILAVAFITAARGSASQQSLTGMAYTVSMPQPSNHLFHVVLRVDGLQGEFHDFKMPAWHPGYYRLIDYANNVSMAKDHEEHLAGGHGQRACRLHQL